MNSDKLSKPRDLPLYHDLPQLTEVSTVTIGYYLLKTWFSKEIRFPIRTEKIIKD